MVTGTLVNRRKLTARSAALVIVTAIALGLAALPASSVTPRAEAAKATEIGITPTTIRVAVVADVDNTLAPGCSRARQRRKGWAKYVDANGGVAGRKLVVDFIDSKLSGDEARNAVIKACSQDFALVGTSALFLNNVDDDEGCVDKAGAATGIPDMARGRPPRSRSRARRRRIRDRLAEVSARRMSAHPQTYQANVGPGVQVQKKSGKDLHGGYITSGDLNRRRYATRVHDGDAADGLGYQGRLRDTGFGAGAAELVHADRAAVEGQVVELRVERRNVQLDGAAATGSEAPRRERPEIHLGLHPRRATTASCQAGRRRRRGPVRARSRSSRSRRPARTRRSANFLKYTGRTRPTASGSRRFAPGLLVEPGIQKIVDTARRERLTRKCCSTSSQRHHRFNAGGMIGTTDIADRGSLRRASWSTQWKGGKFLRVTQPRRARSTASHRTS